MCINLVFANMNYPSSRYSRDKKYMKIRKCSVSCFVPMCPSNSSKFPNKLFLTVPNEPKLREKWLKAAERYDLPSPKSVIRCCEDHFDMENDIENWIKFKLVGGKLYLKKGVIPHIFDCQQRNQTIKPTYHILKCNSLEILETIKNEQEEVELSSYQVTDEQDISNDVENSRDPCTQIAVYSHKRSKNVQVAKIPIRSFTVSPKNIVINHQRKTTIKIGTFNQNYSESENESRIASNMETDGETESTSGSVLSNLYSDVEIGKLALQLTLTRITRDSKLYIGVPNDCTLILNLIQETLQVPYYHICLVLRKLKLNESFKILADNFGIHESTACRIFSSMCCKMANILKKFIVTPTQQSVLANLPVAFRYSFSKIYCIIGCMEIEIEVPSNALHKSLTFSTYKKCNTMKYLISATPDGVINFVSEGFGGCISDIRICKESKFFDCLPPGVSIMADIGFKHIEGELTKRNFTPIKIRLPNVSSLENSSREHILQAKKVASLTTRTERVIRRLQEFSILKSHACIDHDLVQYLDSAIIICSALLNLQSSVIDDFNMFLGR